MRLHARLGLAILLSAVPAGLTAQPRAIPEACRTAVDARLPGWKLSPPPVELAMLATPGKSVTNIAAADFDLDGTTDTALVIAPRRGHPTSHLVICLARAAAPQLHVIREPYGRDGITVRPKGTVDYDYRTGKNVRYWTNGVQAYAFEKAGGTYLFKDGTFVLIVDSD